MREFLVNLILGSLFVLCVVALVLGFVVDDPVESLRNLTAATQTIPNVCDEFGHEYLMTEVWR